MGQGFAEKVKLVETEAAVLRILVAVRLAISVTLGAYSLSKDPSNTYLLLHAEPGWRMLELYWKKLDPILLQDLFRKVIFDNDTTCVLGSDLSSGSRGDYEGGLSSLNLEEEDAKLV